MAFFISESEAERILNHKNNLLAPVNSVRISNLGSGNHNGQTGKSGRTNGSKNYSTEIKALIGLLARTDGVKRTSEKFNLAISQVSHYKNGKPQNKNGVLPDKKLRNQLRIESELKAEELRELVRDKVNAIIESIDDEKINKANLSTATKAAANLSSVFKNFGRDSDSTSKDIKQQFVFFGVNSKAEDEYDVLDAEEVSRS